MESVEKFMNEEKECLIRMKRIYEIALHFFINDQSYLKQVVGSIIDGRQEAPKQDAKKIADFVIRKKYEKNTGKSNPEQIDVRPNLVACLIQDVTIGTDGKLHK